MILHPGTRIALSRLGMDETEVAQAMASGNLASPQRIENATLFALRITGTGTAYRKALDEYVYRSPDNYLNDHFLDRCRGLPVIWEHPKKGTLTSDEFGDRAIGTIVLPYIKGDEVWGVARVYDAIAAKAMVDKQLSTSPAVVFRASDGNATADLDGGSSLLIEGKPSLLDHLAVCAVGVWDKGGEPAGVSRNNVHSNGDGQMADEKDKPESDTKPDADHSAKVLKAIDAMCDRMDGIGKRMDAFEAKFGKKADAEGDAPEEPEDGTKEGEPEEVAADKGKKKADGVKKDAKKPDAEGEDSGAAEGNEPKETKPDAGKLPAFLKGKKKPDADGEEGDDAEEQEAKERDDANKRMDSQIDKRVNDRLRAMGVGISENQPDFADYGTAQSRADTTTQQLGLGRAKPALSGESLRAYRNRLITPLLPYSKTWKGVEIARLDDASFAIAEGQIFADAALAARSPEGIPEGTLREIRKIDDSGRVIKEFIGDPYAWMSAHRPRARVLKKPFFHHSQDRN